jgi:hypothetical protein
MKSMKNRRLAARKNGCAGAAAEGGEHGMDIKVGDTLELKKTHPCGSRRWLVLRVGMDFKLRCAGCGHELMIPRSKAEKAIKKIIPAEEADA